jgi:hypothetical protein
LLEKFLGATPLAGKPRQDRIADGGEALREGPLPNANRPAADHERWAF